MAKNALLHRISNPNQEFSGYLFGTVHIKDQRVIELADRLNKYMSECHIFSPEMSMTEFDPSLYTQTTLLDDPLFYQEVQSPKQNRFFRKWLQNMEIGPIDHCLRQKPMILQQHILQSFLINDTQRSQDEHIAAIAQEKELQIIGLESFEEQMNIFQSIPLEVQWKQLQKLMRGIKTYKRKYKRIITLYLDQQIHTLHRLTKKDLGNQRQLMLKTRNKCMTNRMIAMMKTKKTVFGAVGAAHLGGQFGMINLLKKAGYQLRPIRV